MDSGMQGQRLIDWTGERCVPWADDFQVIYEHYHRYALALQFAAGKRVLDLASGEGYGSALLATRASAVIGLDIDTDSVRHARSGYPLANLDFQVGSIIDPAALADEPPFDVITCFEAVEHVVEQDLLMQLVRNRLAVDGVFLSSTPDVAVYTHDHGNDNPFHVRELGEDEYRKLLGGSFQHVTLLKQNVMVGSLIHGGAGGGQSHTLRRRAEDAWQLEAGAPHTYLVGIASDVPVDVPGMSALVDPELTMVRYAAEAGVDHEAQQAMQAEQAALRESAERSRTEFQTAQETVARLSGELNEMADRVDQTTAEIAQARRAVRETAAELDRERRQAQHGAARLTWLADSNSQLSQTVRQFASENATLRESNSALAQRLIGRYRTAIERYAPRGTRRRDTYERAFGRPTGVNPGMIATPGPVTVSTSRTPIVSVVIPAYGYWAYTKRCLESIQANLPAVPFEVIVVDDASPDDAAARVAECHGVKLVRTPRNLGFVGACNLGAQHVTSELVLFLNNDTEVRQGWLDALVEVVGTQPDVGLVGSKLVYPDGRLQECGGIIWADGNGWNYGRDQDPGQPEYRTVRDVDYCSGAALLVRRDLFEKIGGFDEQYSPAYYEDTDLAFAVRAAGYRTVVQPASVVVHHEGVSNGTSITSGVKRNQEINRGVFAHKWAATLAEHLPEASNRNLWLARQRTAHGHQGGLVLVADHQVPRTDEDSGSVRMGQLLEQLVELDQRVVFFPMNRALPDGYTSRLHSAGVTVIADAGRQAEFLRDAGGDLMLALLSRPHVAWQLLEQIREHAPRCVVAYDTVDLHFLRLGRQADVAERNGQSEQAISFRRRAEVLRELELGLARAVDVTLVVSDFERDLLGELVPEARVEVLSNVHRIDRVPALPTHRQDVLFVGSFDHQPNRDAARWLTEDIMPLVWQRKPDAVAHIVGSNPTPEVLDLARDGVVVHGWVSDLEPIYRNARVVVAPLRFGAGVKGKIGESLAKGVPVAATEIAVEGMHLTHGKDALVGVTAMELAEHLITLLDDDEVWQRLSDAGKAAVDQRFGPHVAGRVLSGLLADAHSA